MYFSGWFKDFFPYSSDNKWLLDKEKLEIDDIPSYFVNVPCTLDLYGNI